MRIDSRAALDAATASPEAPRKTWREELELHTTSKSWSYKLTVKGEVLFFNFSPSIEKGLHCRELVLAPWRALRPSEGPWTLSSIIFLEIKRSHD